MGIIEGNNINSKLSDSCRIYLETLDPEYVNVMKGNADFKKVVSFVKTKMVSKQSGGKTLKQMEDIFFGIFEGEIPKNQITDGCSEELLKLSKSYQDMLLAYALAVEDLHIGREIPDSDVYER